MFTKRPSGKKTWRAQRLHEDSGPRPWVTAQLKNLSMEAIPQNMTQTAKQGGKVIYGGGAIKSQH